MADGSNTDMTAALMVMHSLLAARAPAGQPAAAAPTNQQRQEVAVHGNYKRYYGYRWGGADGEDSRIQVAAHLRNEGRMSTSHGQPVFASAA